MSALNLCTLFFCDVGFKCIELYFNNMIEKLKFEFITQKYGNYSSWAIWADAIEKPKENIGDLSVFNLEINPHLLEILNPNIIFVGLNVSRGAIKEPLGNFHDPRPEGQDYKMRYALKDSPYWGAYITDIIKDYDEKVSINVMTYLKSNMQFEIDNVKTFRQEIDDIGANNPKIIAFSCSVYSILKRNFANEFSIIKIPHYSNWVSKEKYRENVCNILKYT